VVIFNSALWHGATMNPNRIPRANLTSFWSRRVFPDGSRRENRLSQDAFDRLSEPARCLFDPPGDNNSAK
jgi:ectoine hydroxylase-related dioxygenase (phytanoyl-CoA dioxygenase family)